MNLATCLVVYNRNDCWGRYEFGAFCRGLRDEHEEHPHLSLDKAAQIVMDHLDRSPSYYPDDQRGWTQAAYSEPDDEPEENPRQPWTDRETELLAEYAGMGESAKRVAEVLGRSPMSVNLKAHREGISFKSNRWSASETDQLWELSERYSAREVARMLGRTEYGVKQKANRIGADFGSSRHISASEIARNIGAANNTVARWIKKLGLTNRKSKARGKSTPLEVDGAVELLDALLRGEVGTTGRSSGATTRSIRAYRAKLMGEPIPNPPTDFHRYHYSHSGDIPYLIVDCCAHDMVLAWARDLEDDLIDPGYIDELEADFMEVWYELGSRMAERIERGERLAPLGVFAAIMSSMANEGRNQHLVGTGGTYMAAKVGRNLTGLTGRAFSLLLSGCFGQTYIWLRDEVVSLDKLDEKYDIGFTGTRKVDPEEAAKKLTRVVSFIASEMQEN